MFSFSTFLSHLDSSEGNGAHFDNQNVLDMDIEYPADKEKCKEVASEEDKTEQKNLVNFLTLMEFILNNEMLIF